MFLDATDERRRRRVETVDALLTTVRPTEKSIEHGTPFPPIVVFSWGTTQPFVGVVKSVTRQPHAVPPVGPPGARVVQAVDAGVSADPAEPEPDVGRAAQATRAHGVVLGDSLASIANAEYGTPTLWRAIAKVNGLDDPFNLRLGRELLIPPPPTPPPWPDDGRRSTRTNVFQIKVDGTRWPPRSRRRSSRRSSRTRSTCRTRSSSCSATRCARCSPAGKFEIAKRLSISVVSEAAAGGHADLRRRDHGGRGRDRARPDRWPIVRGFDHAHRLQRGTTTETHLDVTYGDIVGKVAQRRGLQKGDGGTNTVVHEAVVQWNQTDWEFLSGLAAEIGHEVVVVDGKLHLREPSDLGIGPGGRRPATQRRRPPARRRRQPAPPAGDDQRRRAGRRGAGAGLGLQRAKEAVAGSAKASRHVAQRVGRHRRGDARRRS